ncbi:MAG: phospholipase D-like domain-containing protein [Rhodobacteraceae bacterium]|nr:phospholipase D-like domain-containing protein [Paracoccaceae bacterium]
MTFWDFFFGVFVELALQAVALFRLLTREDQEPEVRISWIVVVVALPFLGVLLYALFGEARIASAARDRMRRAIESLGPPGLLTHGVHETADPMSPPFARAASVNGFHAVYGNRIGVIGRSEEFIDRLIDDIDAARQHVHIAFYIWLSDRSGTRVADAVIRAARRGVTCRVLVDGLGSRPLLGSGAWRAMSAAGVRLAIAFEYRFSLLQALRSRIDIRNHRKIVVVDGRVAYAGSQNCADAEFAPKARFAPWVDVMLRIEGPVVWQHQYLFMSDWITHSGEEAAAALLREPPPGPVAMPGIPAVAAGSGPELQRHAVSDLFQAAIAAAEREVLIVTPYYVPDASLQQEIMSAALRGIRVRMILPERNDNFIVSRASRAYYRPLLSCGVEIREYRPGLLHAKLIVTDRRLFVAGSANMDRRSFNLNYENSILGEDPDLAAELLALADRWTRDTLPVGLAEIDAWGPWRRVVNNLFGLLAPLL